MKSVRNGIESRRSRRRGVEPDELPSQRPAQLRARDKKLQSFVLRGTIWSVVAQVVPISINLMLTPFVIQHLGVASFGTYIAAGSYLAVLGIISGGILTASARWTAMHEGRGDRPAQASFVWSALTGLEALALAFAGAIYVLAPVVAQLISRSDTQDDTVFLIRVLGVLLLVALPTALFSAVLNARGRFKTTAFANLAGLAAYVPIVVVQLSNGGGLHGLALAVAAKQVIVFLVVAFTGARQVGRVSHGWLPRPEVRRFLAYSGKASLVSVVSTVDQSADSVLLATFVSPRAAGLYGAGAGFGGQLRLLPINALGPMSISLAAEFGRAGHAAAHKRYLELQRSWVLMTAGYSAAALGATYFAVTTWLGPGFQTAATVALVLALGDCVNLWTGVLTIFLNAIGRPDLEVRYGLIALVLNMVLTIPLIRYGPVGVVVGTSTGEVFGSLILVHIVRKGLPSFHIRNFLLDVPWLEATLTALSVIVVDALLAPHLPTGVIGLAGCGLPAAIAFGVYAVCLRHRMQIDPPMTEESDLARAPGKE